ncbi:MAG: M23 family metallopeptidase [Lutibacter sp.]|uniref:M23 family metallopeptidase n=1 Tax=Lutibacter sp. TaxID=1925666 RepID=UPI00299DEECE|nr:M23 family metallopeptidase [Lutibacter sp.]MDX1827986.1 M23 family metallopeptidase [Lutibacter sp.]
MKKLVVLLFIISFISGFSQGDLSISNSLPKTYFKKPLNIPLVLSGTFGELRTNHFHAGLDIKTEQKEGLKVYASANGYVSRIKISLWGYGKALYITHPNGYTTVYAHLSKFNPIIEKYIKQKQYKKESFEIQVFPKSNELPIKSNEIIAYTGSTGGFVGPHLHFEIRNTKTEKPINPMLFGVTIKDNIKPTINTLIGYSLSDSSAINQINTPVQIPFKKLKNGNLLATKINAIGTISFGINAFDRLNNAANKNGLYDLKMLVNGKKQFEFIASTFSFSESKYINLLIDYKRFEELKQRIQKCFIEPQNKLSLYKTPNNGYITIKDGLNYTVKIIASDFKGNKRTITIPVQGKKLPILVKPEVSTTPYKIDYTKFSKFTQNGVTIAFPKNTFYNNLYLKFDVSDTLAKIHVPTVPLNKKFTLTFNVSKYNQEARKQLYIAYVNENGSTSYQPTVKKDSTFYTRTKKLGNYKLMTDSIAPTIKLKNFKDKQWLTHYNYLKVKINDEGSGIKSYRGEIDGSWILMEYNVKKGMLTYNLNDKKFNTAKHQLKVTVTDNVGNKTIVNSTFFRKKL